MSELPRGILTRIWKGGENSFIESLNWCESDKTDGYIKTELRNELNGTGVILLSKGKPILSYYTGKEKCFGNASMKIIKENAKKENCVIRLFTFPSNSKGEVQRFIEECGEYKITERIEEEKSELDENFEKALKEVEGLAELAGGEELQAFKKIVETVEKRKEPAVILPIKEDKVKIEPEELKKEIMKKPDEYVELSNRISAFEKKVFEIKKEIESKPDEYVELSNRISAFEKEIFEIKKGIESKPDEYAELSNRISMIEGDIRKREELISKIYDETRKLEEAVRKGLDEIIKVINEVKMSEKKLDKKRKRLNKLQRDLKMFNKKIKKKEKSVRALEKKLEDILKG